MPVPTLALSVIMRNEAANIDRFFNSIELDKFDQVVVVDTGSTDNSVALVEAWRPKCKDLKIIEVAWRKDFAWARQQGMDACDTDFVMWADLDDELEGTASVRHYLTTNPHVDAFMAKYNYVFTPEGEVVCELIRERIVRKSKFYWKGRLHEVLLVDGPYTSMLIPELVFNHHPDMSAEKDLARKERNIDILLEMVDEDPDEPRTYFYLGNAYMGVQEFEKAKQAYLKYLPMSNWDQEKYQAICRVAKIEMDNGDIKKAKNMLYSAIELIPQMPIAYYVLGEIHYKRGEFEKALDLIETGLDKPMGRITLADNPADYTYMPKALKFEVLANAGRFEDAYRWGQKVLGEIKDEKLREKVLSAMPFVEEMAERDSLMECIVRLRKYLIRNDEAEKAAKLTEAAPYTLYNKPEFKQMRVFDHYNLNDSQQFNEETGLKPLADKLDDLENYLPKAAWLLDWLKKHPDVKTILDVGCNEGWFSFWLERKGYKVVGVDANRSVIDRARAYAADFKSGIEFHYDLEDIGDAKFDAVMAFDVIEHVPDDKAFVASLWGHASKYVLIVTPHGCFARGIVHDAPDGTKQHHLRVYTVKTLKAACKPYWMETCDQITDGHLICAVLLKYTAPHKSLAIFCGATPELWGPDALERGVGGSEEAVIRVAKNLTFRGYDVTIFNQGTSCVEGGVTWLVPDDLDPLDKFDVFISWRNPGLFAFDSLIGIKDAKKYIWLHDVPRKEVFIKSVVDRVDGIFVLSNYHKSLLPEHAQAKAIVTANGIDWDEIRRVPRVNKPHRMVWTSSYLRGLEWLLEAWPDIRKEVPDAELDVMYGWETTDAMPPFPEPHYTKWRNKINELLGQEGITHHGRLPQGRALEVMAGCGVFPYLTMFPEISCISAMKAQAVGAVPFTTTTGALDETNVGGIKMVPQWENNEYKNFNFHIEKLIELLKDENAQAELRSRCIKAAPGFSWETVLDGWEKLFRS